jgi:hypothetical protein
LQKISPSYIIWITLLKMSIEVILYRLVIAP